MLPWSLVLNEDPKLFDRASSSERLLLYSTTFTIPLLLPIPIKPLLNLFLIDNGSLRYHPRFRCDFVFSGTGR